MHRSRRPADRGPTDLRAPRSAGSDRASGLVESAILLLPFFALVFGLIDGSLLLGNSLTARHVVKAGARAASALGNDSSTDYAVLQAIGREGRALNRADILQIVVYNAGSPGAPPPLLCRNGTAQSGVCNVYGAADLDRPATDFGCLPATALDRYWCPTTRRTTLTASTGGPPDYVGVWIKTRHRAVTGIVGSNRQITEKAVLRIEPRRA